MRFDPPDRIIVTGSPKIAGFPVPARGGAGERKSDLRYVCLSRSCADRFGHRRRSLVGHHRIGQRAAIVLGCGPPLTGFTHLSGLGPLNHACSTSSSSIFSLASKQVVTSACQASPSHAELDYVDA